ncbi:MAG: DNA primase [Pseudomonadota bacterium]
MSLPDGFVDELKSRTSLAQIVARKVVWDSRKSNPGRGDYWAPCPFHQEKTASFHVLDTEGYYYCFGCHAKGDALTFIRETENLSFIEAVEVMAAEAGMQMPAQDPAAAAKSKARAGLRDVMEAAVQFTRLQLSTAAARQALEYLKGRGLSNETLRQFEVGFAPNSRDAMLEHLRGKDIPEDDIVKAGLAIKPEDGGRAYDRFRGRIMFPIRDARGAAIAFGGRAMDPQANAKYLNSPETPLFDKGRALFNIGPARAAAGKAQSLIVAEGYMDVIALAQAGFPHSVAPLGTAITEDQLLMMWRVSPEPILALDGDTAGLRAAMRVIDLALPMLEPGRALRFCLMPKGLDPDDLIRAQGPEAMQRALESAVPMVALLWQRETEGQSFDSPERRAALDDRLRRAINRIPNPDIKSHYRDAIREFRRSLFRPTAPRTRSGVGGGGAKQPIGPTPAARNSLLGQKTGDNLLAARVRESAILLGCINHPEVARAVEAELEELRFLCHDLDGLRQRLLQLVSGDLNGTAMNDLDTQTLEHRLAEFGNTGAYAVLSAVGQVRDNPHLAIGADPQHAMRTVRQALSKHRAERGVEGEIRDAEEEITGLADEGLTWRLGQASSAHQSGLRGPSLEEDSGSEDRAAMSSHLQNLIDQQVWLRKKK